MLLKSPELYWATILLSQNFSVKSFEVFSSVNLWEIVNFVIYFTRAFTSQHFSEADERYVMVMTFFFFLI